MNMHRDLSEFKIHGTSSDASLLKRFLRFLSNILSSPHGNQGGWEGGARGL